MPVALSQLTSDCGQPILRGLVKDVIKDIDDAEERVLARVDDPRAPHRDDDKEQEKEHRVLELDNDLPPAPRGSLKKPRRQSHPPSAKSSEATACQEDGPAALSYDDLAETLEGILGSDGKAMLEEAKAIEEEWRCERDDEEEQEDCEEEH